jgi:hypothetical protein
VTLFRSIRLLLELSTLIPAEADPICARPEEGAYTDGTQCLLPE